MSNKSKISRVIIFIYVGALYAVNYPLRLYLNSLYNNPDTLNLRYFELKYLLLLFSFLVLAICIELEKENLTHLHFDRASLVLLAISTVLALPIGPIIFGKYIGSISIAISGLLIFAALIQKVSKIPPVNLRWTLSGIFLTIAVLIPVNFLNLFTHNADEITQISFFSRTIYNVFFVSVTEEIIFRGFLWGYFRSMGLSEKKAFVFQFLLFWLGHGGQINAPLIFLVSSPMITFVLSYLAYRSKQLFPSIASHAMFNVLLDVLWRFG